MGLELRDIHKSFGEIRANDGVTLALEAGAIHGLRAGPARVSR